MIYAGTNDQAFTTKLLVPVYLQLCSALRCRPDPKFVVIVSARARKPLFSFRMVAVQQERHFFCRQLLIITCRLEKSLRAKVQTTLRRQFQSDEQAKVATAAKCDVRCAASYDFVSSSLTRIISSFRDP